MLDHTSKSQTFLCPGSAPDISSPSQGVQCLKLLGKDSWACHQVRCDKSIVFGDTLGISQSHQSNDYFLMFSKYGSHINLHFCHSHSGTGIRPSDKHQNDSKSPQVVKLQATSHWQAFTWVLDDTVDGKNPALVERVQTLSILSG